MNPQLNAIIPKDAIIKAIRDIANSTWPGHDWHIHEFDINAIPDVELKDSPENLTNSWVSLNSYEGDGEA